MTVSFFTSTMLTLLGGLPLTLQLASEAVAGGFLLACSLAYLGARRALLPRMVARAYIFVFRGTPLLLQIYLIYYGLPQFRETLDALGLWRVLREPYWCALIGLSLNTAAYTAEIIRGAMQSVPHGQVEAAKACGMTTLTRFRLVMIPLAIRQGLPAYSNEIILMIKATSLASTITLMEIVGLSQKLGSQTYRPVEILCCAALIYLALVLTVTRVLQAIERWLDAHQNPPLQNDLLTQVPHA